MKIPFFTNGRWVLRDLFDFFAPNPGTTQVSAFQRLVEAAPNKVVDYRRLEKRGRSKARGHREWSSIAGICLHQTATRAPLNPMRFLGIPVHGGVSSEGTIVLLWDPPVYLWHAHALNRDSIGIEIACRAAGVEGDDSTVWLSKKERRDGKMAKDVLREASDVQLEAALALCRYYAALAAENRAALTYIWAHRQGHKSRTSDPGSRIWRGVALPLQARDGIIEGPVMGSGHPIPGTWK